MHKKAVVDIDNTLLPLAAGIMVTLPYIKNDRAIPLSLSVRRIELK